jgi:acetyl esterase/lipase
MCHRLRVTATCLVLTAVALAWTPLARAAESKRAALPPAAISPDARNASVAKLIGPLPLYEGDIPNSKPGPDEESHQQWLNMDLIYKVSRPTYTVYLPPPSRASGAAVLVLPGGGYQTLSWDMEGRWIAAALQDRGIAAILVKYRLPDEKTMVVKSIAPLQDAQQALIQVRRNAAQWGIDPGKVGAMGFSAGGHLASMLGTLYDTALIPNADKINLRPDFLILVYPATSLAAGRIPEQVRLNVFGPHPTDEQVRRFSSALHVTAKTPPTILLSASNDDAVDPDHTIDFYRALRQNQVPAELVLFERGLHGFFELTREEWMSPIWGWLGRNGWLGR